MKTTFFRLVRGTSTITVIISASLLSLTHAAYADGVNWGWSGNFDQLRAADQIVRSSRKVKEIINNDFNSLIPSQIVSDKNLVTTKFQHYFKGMEVIGSMAFHHQSLTGNTVRQELAQFSIDTIPTLSAADATALAQGIVGDRALNKVPELKVLPDAQLSAKLIYHVTLASNEVEGGRDIIIDAHNGDIIGDLPRDLPLASVQVYSTTGKTLEQDSTTNPNGTPAAPSPFPQGGLTPATACQVVDSQTGYPLDMNLKNCDQVVINSAATIKADASARNAMSNSLKVLNYYDSVHHRNSYDNLGSPLVNVVHIGKKFDNAFWSQDEEMMAYGDGDGVNFGDFTTAVDVAGHEMTHGVTSKTAKLMYMSESGALNEAFSDFFGKVIANDGDWVIGKGIFKMDPKKGIRDLATPGNITFKRRDASGNVVTSKYPATIQEKLPNPAEACGRTNDMCWVHINSTIPGHAMYLVSMAIGRPQAEKLFYTVLTQFVSSTADFTKFASATQAACAQIFDATTCGKVKTTMGSIGF